MENIKMPAQPIVFDYGQEGILRFPGFTKLELASLMIAQGGGSDGHIHNLPDFAKYCVNVAKAVLEEANK